MSYYDRTLQADGGFATDEDRVNEQEAAAAVGKAFGCILHKFPKLDAIDFYAERNGKTVGFVEIKARSHASTTYSTVFLNLRKWWALLEVSLRCKVPAIFAVKFTDTLLWIPIAKVDATKHRMGGCTRRVKADTDREPVIEIPISSMRSLQ
jgi:hypothetical protein